MERQSPTAAAAVLLAAAVLASCSAAAGTGAAPSPAAEPGAPPAAEHAHAAAPPSSAHPDVRFMQGMIAHHGQALEMTALVAERTRRADIRLMAERIDVSQKDEIAWMQRWLQRRGEAVPDAHAGHAAHARMPGMLSQEEMARLRAASGAEFDRLFLESMIRHHEGALVMVSELFATPGAAQQSEVYQFATDVNADQEAEIARMRAVLGRGGSPP
ncbi:MAG TPA: DUF305 domain-containing protein [Longimicrobium sp.]|nr:DUF305 domain-containing protein [Longimicrobium sp.]